MTTLELEEFEIQIKRLKDQWPYSFSNERTLRIWNSVEELPLKFVEDAVSHFLAKFPKAPLVPDFEKYFQTWSTNQNVELTKAIEADPVRSAEVNNCKLCKEHIDTPGLIFTAAGVLRCSCPLGDLHSKDIPRRQVPGGGSNRTYAKPENEISNVKPFGEKD